MSEYPLIETARDRLRTPTGKKLDEIAVDAVLAGEVTIEDLRITPEALAMQAEIAEEALRPQLAENLRRAAELVAVPEEKILEIYTALRPGRATRERLLELAGELETRYRARRCAALLREAAQG